MFKNIKGLTLFSLPMLDETFLHNSSVCLEQESRSSIIRPNDFVCLTLLIMPFSVLTHISSSLSVYNFCLEPMIMNSVLAVFRLSLFASSQQFILHNSELMSGSSSPTSLAEKFIVVSSAKDFAEALLRQLGKSLM